MKNAFEKMCNELSEIKACRCSMCVASNEHVCAYNAVKEYVGKDKNKLLKLKAEAKEGDYNKFITTILAVLSFYLGADILVENSQIMKVLFLIVLLGLLVYVIIVMHQYKGCYKWRKYIQVAIEEIENPKNPDNPENLSKKS